MNKIIFIGLLIMLSFLFMGIDVSHQIELKPGMNEISIKVLNNSNVDLDSLHVVMKKEDLPEGLFNSKSSQQIELTAKSKSANGLLLHIEVDENATAGVYMIPFTLRDKSNHSWHFTLTANLESTEPKTYSLLQNYPNPFNFNTRIEYVLANNQEKKTQLVIFDLLGRQVRMLVNKRQPAETYKIIWDGTDDFGNQVTSGVYFYKITSGTFVKIKKLVLLK